MALQHITTVPPDTHGSSPLVRCPLKSISPARALRSIPPPSSFHKLNSLCPRFTLLPAKCLLNVSHSPCNRRSPQPPAPLDETEVLFSDSYNLLRLSVRYGDVGLAKAIHALALKLEEDTDMGNGLIVAYLKLGVVEDAYEVFVGLSSPDVVSYSAMVSGFAKSNREVEAVRLFFRMRDSGIEPNEFSFVGILTACIRLLDLRLGHQIHAMATKTGFLDCTFVSNALMALFSNGGLLELVLQLFDKMPQRDITSWNTVISSVVKESMFPEAFEFFRDMQLIDDLKADCFTVSALLSAATGGFCRREGREIHAHAARMGFDSSLNVNNSLIGFYRRCGSVDHVVALFENMPVKNVITWTKMMTAYLEVGLVDLAVKIFDEMPIRNCVSYNALLSGFCLNDEGSRAVGLFLEMLEDGVELTEFTFTSIVKACGLLNDTGISRQIHGFVTKVGCGANAYIEAALLDMCVQCGRMDDAQKMFHHWPFSHDRFVAMSSMMCGYARNGQPDEAISLLRSHEAMGIDSVASTVILDVCGALGFHEMGEQIHCHAVKSGFLIDRVLGNALLSMHAKCGDMASAMVVFHLMPSHDTLLWNGLIAGHIMHRQGDKALAVWTDMKEVGTVKPDRYTFMLIISAYRYTQSNLVNQCYELLESMGPIYGIQPASEHYASLIGVLGYWGLLETAEEVIARMPFEPEAPVWRALLDSSRICLDPGLGKWAAKSILAMETGNPAMLILQSNLYSASGLWHCSERVREHMRVQGFKKLPGQSWVVHRNVVHSFYSRDKSHPQWKDVYRGLEILVMECMRVGYVPDTSFVVQEVEEHQKKDFLFYHSAKLAVTYGLLMTGRHQRFRVVKNIRLCGDCHRFFKYVSVVTKREMCIRDASGFHVFTNGQCSCRNYW